ncbi:hypothetical protein CLD22_23165 [Rubrivivax gelatinosus]|nr:hypothetical protein [Rubrivivax gelatinosus]
MIRLAALLLLCCPALAPAQTLRLPLAGTSFVCQGGDTINVNHHMTVQAQWFGVDFCVLGGPQGNLIAPPGAARNEDFYCWGKPVLAPADGRVQAVVADQPDQPLGRKDGANPAGNHVVLDIGGGRWVFLAHLQAGSVAVRPGETVRVGQPLGRCGNSGNTDFPHLHLHVQDAPAFGTGTGQNPVFEGIDVSLNGKVFENVSWPLITGLFVAPH